MSTAIYTRISRDRTGAGMGVARQEREVREHFSLSTSGVIVYSDNDLSAYSGKPRPGYQQLLEDIKTGKVTRLLAWHPDRLHRSPAELEAFIDVVDQARVPIETKQAGALDLATPTGRMVARIVGSIARGESEHKAERIKSKHAELATAGKTHGGRRRYGYADGMTALVADEAAVVREIANRLLAGDSLHAIAGDLNARGITTLTGKAWRGPNLRNLMLGAHLAGLRTHQGAVVADAQWPAILERDTWAAVGSLLRDPSRRVSESTARKYVLTGLAHCSECALPIRGRMVRGRSPQAYAAYMCQSTAHVQVPVADVDDLVAKTVASRLSEASDLGDLLAPGDDGTHARLLAEEDTLRARLDGLADDYADGVLDRDQVRRARVRIDTRMAEIAQQVAGLDVTSGRPERALVGLVGRDFAATLAAYLDLPLDRQRAVLSALGAEIVIHPAEHRGAGYSAERVGITWHADSATQGAATSAA